MIKNSKKIIIFSIIFALMICLTGSVFAVSPNTIVATSSDISNTMGNLSGIILQVVQVIGTAVAVIMLIVLAIKYISAAPNDKAEIKKHAVVYVVGAIILFAASGILGLIQSFSNNIHN